jgi:hypothetical protein
MVTPVVIVPSGSIRGLWVVLEAIILGALAYFYLGETVHPVFRILIGFAVFLIYPHLYLIPYVGVALNTIVSLLYAGFAGASVWSSMKPRVDRIWIGSASIVVLIFSFVSHRKIVEVVREDDPIHLLRFFGWIRWRTKSWWRPPARASR